MDPVTITNVPAEQTTTTTANAETPPAEPAAKPEAAPVAAAKDEQKAEERSPKIGADRFAALTRKERQLVQQQKEFSAQRAQLAKEREEVAAFRKAQESARTDPLSYLKAAGLEYEDVTNFVLNDNRPTPDAHAAELRSEIERLREEVTQREEERAQQAQRAEQERLAKMVDNWRKEVVDEVTTNADKYELTNLHGQQALVAQVIEEYHAETGKILSTDEGAKLVESFLEETITKSLEAKKVKAKIQPRTEPKKDQGDGKPADEQLTAQRRTGITNEMTTTTPSIMRSATTEKERMARAMAALNSGERK